MLKIPLQEFTLPYVGVYNIVFTQSSVAGAYTMSLYRSFPTFVGVYHSPICKRLHFLVA